tara:strand:- start:101 stop:277 length:177 start_codon:yes stop_codon:yes gene_type:complete
MIGEIIKASKMNLIELAIATIGILAIVVMFIPKESWLGRSLGVFGELFGFLGKIFSKK